jgi:hypothetical protein
MERIEGVIMEQKATYSLSSFSIKEKMLAKVFISKAMLGFINVTITDKVNDLFNQLSKRSFDGEDHLILAWQIDILGNDLLAALGSARAELRRVK